jgi:DNA-binding beta-propeller fold protein YncE
MSARRPAALVTLAVTAATALFAALPALAAERYGPITGRIGEPGAGGSGNGELSSPSGVAIDRSTGDVYVADSANNRVQVFTAAGTYMSQFNGAATPFGTFSGPTAIAVDQASHDVYVADTANNVVDRFTGSGEYICELSGIGRGCQPAPAEPSTFEEPLGVAVDPSTGEPASGDVYVSDKAHRLVDVFTAAGSDVTQFEPSGAEGPFRPWSLAVDSQSRVYVAGAGAERVVEYTALAGEHLREYTGNTISSTNVKPRTIGVDPATGTAFVGAQPESGEGYELFELGPAGDPIPSPGVGFGAGLMAGFATASPGIAVSAGTSTVYAADPAENVVDMFALVTVPDPGACQAPESLQATTATLKGTINPLATSEASYHFQYGTSQAYGLETPATPVEGSGALPAEAAVTELEPGATYHCRLDATNSTGVVEQGPDGTFTTPPLAPAEFSPNASNITATGALLHGFVNPGNGTTSYHFIYGETTAYGHALPAIGLERTLNPVAVEQATETLKPGTEYHFVLVAENQAGETTGEDAAFTTPAAGTPPSTPPSVLSEGVGALTPSAATITAEVNAQGAPSIYTLELGAGTSYETSIFGDAGSSSGPITLTIPLTGLQPAGTYHFRITVSNAAGTTHGADETFTTPGFPTSILQPATPLLIPFTPPNETPPAKTIVKPKPLTRAQKLAKALKACKRKPKKQRAACVKNARQKYAPAKNKRK